MRGRVLTVLIGMAACGRIRFDPRDDGGGPRIADVALGNSHTCAVASTGLVKCWGENSWGILGLGSSDTSPRGDQPGEVAALPSISLGTGTQITAIAAVVDYTCALVLPGEVKCWGNNDGFQLGTGDQNSRGDQPDEMGDNLRPVGLPAGTTSEVATGHYHTCALRSGGVACWGNNDTSQLGYAAPRTSAAQLATLTPVDLGTFGAAQIDAGFNMTCALDLARGVKCWGQNGTGELGLGDTATRGDTLADMGAALPFVDLGAVTVRSIATGHFHSCALTTTGVKCWGNGGLGALGLGAVANRGDGPNEMGDMLPFVDLGGTALELAAGSAFTCALLVGGDVKCWGDNTSGQLGVGDTNDRGDNAGEMGDALPTVPLPGPAVAVRAGAHHACAILASGELACWGRNLEGQLGAGDLDNRCDQAGEPPIVHTIATLWP